MIRKQFAKRLREQQRLREDADRALENLERVHSFLVEDAAVMGESAQQALERVDGELKRLNKASAFISKCPVCVCIYFLEIFCYNLIDTMGNVWYFLCDRNDDAFLPCPRNDGETTT
jgi:hypothetical protein